MAVLAIEESRETKKRRDQEIIAKIKALAAAAGISVAIAGQRGSPRTKP
jgi:hypothetical protein